jgi:tellurite resistance protein
MLLPMTPGEKNIVKSLVAVAWADGNVAQPESGVIEGLLCGFDASDAEEQEILEYARHRRTLDEDAPLGELNREDRALLLANAALLTHADGQQTPEEQALLGRLSRMLEFDPREADAILASVAEGAFRLGRPMGTSSK